MRTINATLQAALDGGGFNTYIKAEAERNSITSSHDVMEYRLTGTTLELKVLGIIPVSTVALPTTIKIIRGVTIAGVNYTLSTSKFTSVTGNLQSESNFTHYISTVKAHLIKPIRVNFLADGSFEDAIASFCTAIGKTYTLRSSSAGIWARQFLPTGNYVEMNNAQSFLNMLRQKGLIYACDNGGEDILFACGTEVPGNRDYDIPANNIYNLQSGFIPRCRYIAKDEAGVLRYSGTAGDVLHNLGFILSTDSLPTVYEQDRSINPYAMPIQLYPQDGDSIDFADSQTILYPAKITEIFNPDLPEIPWRIQLEQHQMFSRSDGGIATYYQEPYEVKQPSTATPQGAPSTISSPTPIVNETASLPTGTFTETLSEYDNSILAALETLDKHAHAVTGSTFPTAPVTGQQWTLSLTGRKIIYQYDGTDWQPMRSLGTMTLYVDKTDGTDSLLQGTGVNAAAFKTIQYAINCIPPSYGGNVTININNESYNEDLVIEGKEPTGAHYIILDGTLSQLATGTIDSSTQGSGATQGTLTDTGAFGSYDNKIVYCSTPSNQYEIIDSDTANVLTVCGTFYVAAPTGTYIIYDWGTEITGAVSLSSIHSPNLIFRRINFNPSSRVITAENPTAQVEFDYCKLNGQVGFEALSQFLARQCLFLLGSSNVAATDNGIIELIRCKLIRDTGTYGIFANTGGVIYIDGGCVFEGVTVAGGTVGAYASNNGVIFFDTLWSTSMGNARVRNWSNGLLINTGGQISGTTPQFSGNTLDSVDSNAGTYTPTLTNTTNIDSSTVSGPFTYCRVGNIVTVAGGITVDPTAAAPTNTAIGISLPIASNFTGSFDGTGNGTAQVSNCVGNLAADATNDRMTLTFQAPVTTSMAWRVVFQYEVK